MIKNLPENERVIKIGYRPILIYFWQILAAIFLVVAPFFLMIPLFGFGWWGQLIFFFLIGLGVLFLIRTFFVWAKNILIITNQQIIILSRRGFLDQQVVKIGYEKIRDVVLLTRGIIHFLTKSSNLQINLIDGGEPLKFNNLVDGLKIQELIISLQNNSRTPPDEIVDRLSGNELINLARKIRGRLGPALLKKISEEETED